MADDPPVDRTQTAKRVIGPLTNVQVRCAVVPGQMMEPADVPVSTLEVSVRDDAIRCRLLALARGSPRSVTGPFLRWQSW